MTNGRGVYSIVQRKYGIVHGVRGTGRNQDGDMRRFATPQITT